MESTDKKICYKCVSETYLQAVVKKHGKRYKCSYCSKNYTGFKLEELAEYIDDAFNAHYIRTPEQNEFWIPGDYDERDGELITDVIAEEAGICELAASDIRELLRDLHYDHDAATIGEEQDFDEDSYYSRKEFYGEGLESSWQRFENVIKTESRYFNREGAILLNSIFAGLDKLKVSDGRPLIVCAGTEHNIKKLSRARAFQTDEKLKEALNYPDKHLGPPPSTLAMPGRMNARGISVFYGADRDLTAIAEVRPPVGSKVAVAIFDITRTVTLLDLTALPNTHIDGSIFDPQYAKEMERLAFLKILSERISQPVMPDDEFVEYLITQAIADYLSSGEAFECDGIIYPAIQAGKGINVVLFHKAALVEGLRLVEGTKIETHIGLYAGDEMDIPITTTMYIPDKTKPALEKTDKPVPWLDRELVLQMAKFGRLPTLRIDPNSIKVNHIKSVQFQVDGRPVRRTKMPLIDEASLLDE